MRILYFSRGYTPHDFRFLSAIASEARQVYFLQLQPSRVTESRRLPQGVRVIRCEFPSTDLRIEDGSSFAPVINKILDDVKPDLVHAGPIHSSAFLTALCGFRPLISMSWGSDLLTDAEASQTSMWATRYTLNRSAYVVTDCAEVSARVLRYSCLGADRIVQFPWGVDLGKFHPAGSHHPVREIWASNCVIVSLRAWEPHYGIMTLLEGFSRAAALYPELRLLLLGDGSLRNQIRTYLARAGLASVVHTPGFAVYAELPDYLRAADAYISCSESDGSSVSLMEALACGLPVIVTDRPSNREWITPGENGWLVPYGDSGAVGQALVRAGNLDPELRRVMSLKNRQIAEERADWPRNVSKLFQIYHSVTSSDPGGQKS